MFRHYTHKNRTIILFLSAPYNLYLLIRVIFFFFLQPTKPSSRIQIQTSISWKGPEVVGDLRRELTPWLPGGRKRDSPGISAAEMSRLRRALPWLQQLPSFKSEETTRMFELESGDLDHSPSWR